MLKKYTLVESTERINELVEKGSIGTVLMVFPDNLYHYEVEFFCDEESLGTFTVSENQIVNVYVYEGETGTPD